jgi:hypothetical protein
MSNPTKEQCMHGRAVVDPCPDCDELATRESARPSKEQETPWWCSTCNKEVPGVEVTYDETHDLRAGGCGQHVFAGRSAVLSSNLVSRLRRAIKDVEVLNSTAGITAEHWYMRVGRYIPRDLKDAAEEIERLQDQLRGCSRELAVERRAVQLATPETFGDAADAARYRWLRDKAVSYDGCPHLAAQPDRYDPPEIISGAEAETLIDAAMSRAEKTSEDWCMEHGYQQHKRDSPACERASKKAAWEHLRSTFEAQTTRLSDLFVRELRKCLDCLEYFNVHTSRPVNGND